MSGSLRDYSFVDNSRNHLINCTLGRMRILIVEGFIGLCERCTEQSLTGGNEPEDADIVAPGMVSGLAARRAMSPGV
jgi:hypothetical protein